MKLASVRRGLALPTRPGWRARRRSLRRRRRAGTSGARPCRRSASPPSSSLCVDAGGVRIDRGPSRHRGGPIAQARRRRSRWTACARITRPRSAHRRGSGRASYGSPGRGCRTGAASPRRTATPPRGRRRPSAGARGRSVRAEALATPPRAEATRARADRIMQAPRAVTRRDPSRPRALPSSLLDSISDRKPGQAGSGSRA